MYNHVKWGIESKGIFPNIDAPNFVHTTKKEVYHNLLGGHQEEVQWCLLSVLFKVVQLAVSKHVQF